MKTLKQFLQIFLLTFILFGYVNCSLKSSLVSPLFQTSMKSSGNGGGYEGKPDGSYYHYIPNYTCSGQSSPEGITEIKDGQAYLYDNKGSQCSTAGTSIPISDINFSPFQNEFISVHDQLFKRYEVKPEGIPNNLAEVLCRDDFTNPTFEIVSHFDRETNQTQARVYFSDGLQPDFPISRILSSQEVSYVSDQIHFKVDFSKPSLPQKKYAGHIDSTTLKQIKTQNLTCVIGGSLDTSHWTLHQLSDLSTSYFDFTGLGEIVFSFQISKFVSHIYKVGLDNAVIDFTKKLLGNDYSSLAHFPMSDKNLWIFQARSFSETFDSWYLYNFKNDRVTRMTHLQSDSTKPTYLLNNPEVTENRHLIYSETHPFYPETTILHDLNLETDVMNDFVNIPGRVLYKTLSQSHKVIIAFPEIAANKNLQIYDLNTQLNTNLPINLPESCTLDLLLFEIVNAEQSVLSRMICTHTTDLINILISLKDGSIKSIVTNKYLPWISDDKKWLLLGDLLKVTDPATGLIKWNYSSKNPLVYNMETNHTFQIPIDPNFNPYGAIENNGLDGQGSIQLNKKPILIENQWLYGFGGDLQKPIMYQVDLKTGLSTKFCEATAGRKVFIGTLPNQKLYLFTYDNILKIYRFYSVKNVNDCPLINEFPSLHGAVTDLKATNLGFALALGDGNMQLTNEAVFVPTDGRPPLKLSSGDHGPWQIDVSPNKNRIILMGPSQNDELKLFSFDLF